MTVDELIERLQTQPGDRLVVVADLATDPYHPDANPLTGLDVQRFRRTGRDGYLLDDGEDEPDAVDVIALYTD